MKRFSLWDIPKERRKLFAELLELCPHNARLLDLWSPWGRQTSDQIVGVAVGFLEVCPEIKDCYHCIWTPHCRLGRRLLV